MMEEDIKKTDENEVLDQDEESEVDVDILEFSLTEDEIDDLILKLDELKENKNEFMFEDRVLRHSKVKINSIEKDEEKIEKKNNLYHRQYYSLEN